MSTTKKTVGIVAAKGNSKRFPDKNIHTIDGVPMFWHSVIPLMECRKVSDVYVATDSLIISNYCIDHGVKTIHRSCNMSYDEDPLLSVLKFAYQSLSSSFDYVVTIMANCPGHNKEDVARAIDLIEEGNHNEIRGFNDQGVESGLLVFKNEIIRFNTQISSHIGCVHTSGMEIHYIEDIDLLKGISKNSP